MTKEIAAPSMGVEIYPVVHIDNKKQALEQTEIALDNGADGIFLIEKKRKADPQRLTSIFNFVASRHPDDFIGVNYLPISHPVDVFEYVHDRFSEGKISRVPDGIWVGNTTRDAQRKSAFESVEVIRHECPELRNIRYLGGVAFKYNPLYTEDPKKAAEQVKAFGYDMDVIVTSGKGTGAAPSIEKIQSMKEAAGEKPLAIASGISELNLLSYRGLIDVVLVSTSVETEPYSGEFDEQKLKKLIDLAHS